jgi:hypothetical protein
MDKIRTQLSQQLQTELPKVEKNCYWVEPELDWDDRFKHREREIKTQQYIEQLKQSKQQR